MNDDIKEILQAVKESYDETMPKQEFNRYLKYIEDYIWSAKLLLDYITNLQKENEELKADNQELQDAVVWWNNRYNALQRDYEDYKSRCEKAVEYIKDIFKDEKWYENYEYNDLENALKNVSNILNGRSDK